MNCTACLVSSERNPGTRQELCRIRSTLNSQLSIANCAPAMSALANATLPRTGHTSGPASSAPNRAGPLEMQTHQECPPRRISPLEYALTKNAPATIQAQMAQTELARAGASRGLRRGSGGRGGPVGRSELHAPEMRRRGEELDTDALSLLRGIAQIHDAALLFFLGEGVDQHDHRAVFDRLVQIEQPAVRIDDNRFASLAEFPAIEVLACGHDTHTHEHA